MLILRNLISNLGFNYKVHINQNVVIYASYCYTPNNTIYHDCVESGVYIQLAWACPKETF
jgi:hypothetical protein